MFFIRIVDFWKEMCFFVVLVCELFNIFMFFIDGLNLGVVVLVNKYSKFIVILIKLILFCLI